MVMRSVCMFHTLSKEEVRLRFGEVEVVKHPYHAQHVLEMSLMIPLMMFLSRSPYPVSSLPCCCR
jgi:hypothetical protein